LGPPTVSADEDSQPASERGEKRTFVEPHFPTSSSHDWNNSISLEQSHHRLPTCILSTTTTLSIGAPLQPPNPIQYDLSPLPYHDRSADWMMHDTSCGTPVGQSFDWEHRCPVLDSTEDRLMLPGDDVGDMSSTFDRIGAKFRKF